MPIGSASFCCGFGYLFARRTSKAVWLEAPRFPLNRRKDVKSRPLQAPSFLLASTGFRFLKAIIFFINKKDGRNQPLHSKTVPSILEYTKFLRAGNHNHVRSVRKR